ncbi:hypothetical protein OC835_006173 [Tilletia horrida]|nr:hypothetical protein OC835_006173 [Tilletia horrida]
MNAGAGFTVPGVPASLLTHLPALCDVQRNNSKLNEDISVLRGHTRSAAYASAQNVQGTKRMHGRIVNELHHLEEQVKDELYLAKKKVNDEVQAVHLRVQGELDAVQQRMMERLASGIISIEKQLAEGTENSEEVFQKMLAGIQECAERLQAGSRLAEEDKIRLASQLALFASWASAWLVLHISQFTTRSHS